MLKHWLIPPDDTLKQFAATLADWQWGQNIDFYTGDKLDYKKYKIAILSAGNAEGILPWREHLYKLAYNTRNLNIIDLGHLKGDEKGLPEIVHTLTEHHVIPLIVAPETDYIFGQFKGYDRSHNLINAAVIDNKLSFTGDPTQATYLDRMVSHEPKVLFHYINLGYQTYFVDPAAFERLDQYDFEYHRLGKIRGNIEETEPVLRDADMVAFHMHALRTSEIPAYRHAAPGGLFAEDAFRMIRYAGMSDKLSSVGLYGSEVNDPHHAEQTALTIALMAWYFTEGVSLRTLDFPVFKKNFTTYLVPLKEEGLQLTFWKSLRSERWWVEMPRYIETIESRHKLVPCSYPDYEAACAGELPERLLRAIHRFGKS